MLNKIGPSLGLALLLAACGPSPKEEMLNRITGIPEAKALFFSGDYRSGCQAITFNGKTLYQKDSLLFIGLDVGSVSDPFSGTSYPTGATNTFTNESILYADASCSQPLAAQSAKGKYQLASKHKELTLDATTLTLRPKRDDLASALSSQRFCGYSDWKTDSSKDLLAGSCAAGMQTAHYFVNSHDAEARVIDLILCLDEALENCQTVTYLRQ